MRRTRTGQPRTNDAPDLPKYSIAVASDLSGVPPQQLRRMEESGLVTPKRSQGNTRRYSDNDLQQIAAVSELAEDGVNAAGIRLVLELQTEVAALRAEMEALRRQVAALADAHVPQARRGGPAEASAKSTRGRRGHHGRDGQEGYDRHSAHP